LIVKGEKITFIVTSGKQHMELGEALRGYRKTHLLAQKQLAAQIGISRKHYARIEEGHDHPFSTILTRICEMTGIVQDFRPPPRPKNINLHAGQRRCCE
jgi:transcriptional regulator with XRE-family HTH domain